MVLDLLTAHFILYIILSITKKVDRMIKEHGEINSDFFEKIDTKEKAYWLGLLYADGWLTRVNRNRDTLRLGFNTHIIDSILIEGLCNVLGLDHQRIYHKRMSHKKTNPNSLEVSFANKKLTSDLVRLGFIVGKEKSKNIEFPTFDRRDLELAFLLGYYDGDGKTNKTIICSGSLKFLEKIKEKYILPFKIVTNKRSHYYKGKLIAGTSYELSLGAQLFNEMMVNYEDSLLRKRKHFCTPEEKAARAAESNKNSDGITRKFNITREKLKKLVWEKPSVQIAKKFGVSDRLILKRCRQLGVEKPPRGYWRKKRKKQTL